jgi:hypothetical protein
VPDHDSCSHASAADTGGQSDVVEVA